MRQAFLIITHNEYEILQCLVDGLDNAGCDIYLLVDKKSPLPKLKSSFARLYVLKNRVDIRWGHSSQIKAEMALFKAAHKNGPYLYYHLLSGTDLPIKPIAHILSFFELNKGKEFVGFSDVGEWRSRVMLFHFFIDYYRRTGKLSDFVNRWRYHIDKWVNRFIKRTEYDFQKGSNWVSITEEFCTYLLSK